MFIFFSHLRLLFNLFSKKIIMDIQNNLGSILIVGGLFGYSFWITYYFVKSIIEYYKRNK